MDKEVMEDFNKSENQSGDLGKFLLKEYDNIAEAHFKTLEMISEFIKHYLTIIAIPFTVVVLLFNIDYLRNQLSQKLPGIYVAPIIAVLFWVIGAIGLLMLWHIINLRWDALLYARTINGIRKYFYDHDNELNMADKTRLRVLPQSTYFPIYREFSFFGPVVLAFAIFNTLYIYGGTIAWSYGLGYTNPFGYMTAAIGGGFFTFHIVLYLYFAQQREHRYLQSCVLGVDIDGVLNLHEEHFCRILKDKTGKQISPELITTIPIRDCSGLNVTQSDEFAVFNEPKYWQDMPVNPDAADTIRRLRNSMRLKVHIFTSRPWPITVYMSKSKAKNTKLNWRRSSKLYRKDVNSNKSRLIRLKLYWNNIWEIKPYKIRRFHLVAKALLNIEKPIERITKDWLRKHGFKYDKLMVEQGSEDVVSPGAHVHNRFYASRVIPIKYFVEDDAIKAGKLAYICDVVFLINHPYNQSNNLPQNVIRVNSWKEIYQHLRVLW